MYHYTLMKGDKTVHHFFDEFDNEQAARSWCSQLTRQHFEEIDAGTL
jgi:hypothetical protein